MTDKQLQQYLKSESDLSSDSQRDTLHSEAEFSRRVMDRLPRRGYSPVVVWAIRLSAAVVALLVTIPLIHSQLSTLHSPFPKFSSLISQFSILHFPFIALFSLSIAALTLLICRRYRLL